MQNITTLASDMFKVQGQECGIYTWLSSIDTRVDARLFMWWRWEVKNMRR